MIKKMFLLMALMMSVAAVWAIPAHRGVSRVTQPDGTVLSIQLCGDEFYCFNTTDDGYTVVQSADGYYEYARRQGDRLVSTGVLAHDAGARTAAEKALLAGLTKRLTDRAEVEQSKVRRAQRDGRPDHVQRYDYSKFKGLIILINYTDVKFTMDDPNTFYDHMVNDENFTGYTDNGQFVSCTGSVRDYFDSQSSGRFRPHFDIVGPVNVNYKSTDHNRTSNSSQIFTAALTAANPTVDFSQYDTDSDGVVDMVYFLCAGMSSSFSGNNTKLLWPHRSRFYSSAKYDGKVFYDYACSTELYGWQSDPSGITIEGIGTFCHEFSHVLGFPDFYDADYGSSGGESHHPGDWDVMAGGGGFNFSRTPCGYSIFERYSLGWANPTVITGNGDFSLQPVNVGNHGYIIKTPVNNEYFIMENRQRSGWDAYLPGHGMLIARVDSTNTAVWTQNKVNNNPNHNYYELLRAGNGTEGESSSDPFPGTSNVTWISNNTTPNLKTWAQQPNELMIYGIAENGGVISFSTLREDEVQSIVEDFENMPTTTSTTQENVQGTFAKWNFSKANVMSPAEAEAMNGQQATGITSGGVITMVSDLNKQTYMLQMRVNNPTTTVSKFKLAYSVDQGETWTVYNDALSVKAKSTDTLTWNVTKNNAPIRFRINMSGGSSSKKSYIDDITIYHLDDVQPKPDVPGDVTGDGQVDIADVSALINIMLGAAQASDYPGDANIDGLGGIDIADVSALINIMLGK